LRVVAPHGPSTSFASRCLGVFDDASFHSQAPRGAGDRPRIDVQPFEAAQHAQLVASFGAWSLSAVLVDHHPVAPAVGYVVEHERARVAVSGDTAVCDGVRELAEGVDVLVHETLRSDQVPPELLDWNAGARSVGELAATTKPRTLVLTHLIPSPDGEDDERAYIDEVRTGGYDGPTLVAYDGLRIPI
jgi:ribonuclease Z